MGGDEKTQRAQRTTSQVGADKIQNRLTFLFYIASANAVLGLVAVGLGWWLYPETTTGNVYTAGVILAAVAGISGAVVNGMYLHNNEMSDEWLMKRVSKWWGKGFKKSTAGVWPNGWMLGSFVLAALIYLWNERFGDAHAATEYLTASMFFVPAMAYSLAMRAARWRCRFLMNFDDNSLSARNAARREMADVRKKEAADKWGMRLPATTGAYAQVLTWSTEVALDFKTPHFIKKNQDRFYGAPQSLFDDGYRYVFPSDATGPHSSGLPQMVGLGGTGKGKSVLAAARAAAGAIEPGARVIYLTLKNTPSGESTATLIDDILGFGQGRISESDIYSWPNTPRPALQWSLLKGLTHANDTEMNYFIDAVIALSRQNKTGGAGDHYVAITEQFARELFKLRHLIGRGGFASAKNMLDPNYFKATIRKRLKELTGERAEPVAFRGEVDQLKATLKWLNGFLDDKERKQVLIGQADKLVTSIEALDRGFPNVNWSGEGAYWDNQQRITIVESPSDPALAAFLLMDLCHYANQQMGSGQGGLLHIIVDEVGTVNDKNGSGEMFPGCAAMLAEGFEKGRSKNVRWFTIGQSIETYGERTLRRFTNSGAVLLTMQSQDPKLNDLIISQVTSTAQRETTSSATGLGTNHGMALTSGIDVDLIKNLKVGEGIMVGDGGWTMIGVPYCAHFSNGQKQRVEALTYSMSMFGRNGNGALAQGNQKQVFYCGACGTESPANTAGHACRECGGTIVIGWVALDALQLQGPRIEAQAHADKERRERLATVGIEVDTTTEAERPEMKITSKWAEIASDEFDVEVAKRCFGDEPMMELIDTCRNAYRDEYGIWIYEPHMPKNPTPDSEAHKTWFVELWSRHQQHYGNESDRKVWSDETEARIVRFLRAEEF